MLECDRLSKVVVRLWYRLHIPFTYVSLSYFERHPNPLRQGFGFRCPMFHLVDMMVAATPTANNLKVMDMSSGRASACAFFPAVQSFTIILRYVGLCLRGRRHEFFVVRLP